MTELERLEQKVDKLTDMVRQLISDRHPRYIGLTEAAHILGVSRTTMSNRLNNRPDNLSLGSHSQNMMDRPYRTRRALALNASRHQLSYHTDEEVAAIKEFYRHTRSYQRTMQHFGLTSKGTLFYMLNRR